MKKNDIFTFTAPNGVEVIAVVIEEIHVEALVHNDVRLHVFLCYGQNRLFKYAWFEGVDCVITKTKVDEEKFVSVVVDYAILPDYDEVLARYNDLEVAQAETQSGM